MKIGVFDSGIGGKTVLAEIQKILPEEDYIYIADSENCPYGEKAQAELEKIVSKVVEKLLTEKAEMIVVACNTATTRTIRFLREKYPEIPFVGTEPAIKKACEETPENAKIVLLATEATASSERTKELIAQNVRAGQEVIVVPCPGLAKAIEDGDETKIEANLKKAISETKTPHDKVSGVVLGCTHYPLIREKIQAKFPRAQIFDGAVGVAKEVKKILEEQRGSGR